MRATSSPDARQRDSARRLALLAALAFVVTVAAAGVEVVGPRAEERPARLLPVRIRAKRAHARSVREPGADGRRDLVVFEGSVSIVRGAETLRCERAALDFVAANEGGRVAERIEATGRVRLETPTRRAEGERLLYEADAGRVTLSGPPRPAVRQSGDVIRADAFLYFPEEDRFEAAGFVAARLAASPAEGTPAPEEEAIVSRERETLVECAGGASWDRPLGQGVFREGVRVRQEGFDLACDELYVTTEERPGPSAAGETRARIRRLTAAGNVRLTTRTRTATGVRAVYDPEARVFEIRGEPAARLREGDVTLEAPGIRYIVGEEKWESVGGPFHIVKGKKEGAR